MARYRLYNPQRRKTYENQPAAKIMNANLAKGLLVILWSFALIACANTNNQTQTDTTILQMVEKINTSVDPAFVYKYEQTRFVPPAGKTLLIMGQNQEEIVEYMESHSEPVIPGGWMTYWGIPSLDGVYETHMNETGTSQNHQYLVERFPDTVLQSALWMTGKWDVLSNTVAGEFDSVVIQFSAWAKTTKRPVYLRIGYEFDGRHNELEPEAYVKAYRRIVDLVRAEGADNIAFVWHSYASPTYRGFLLSDWYPGNEYVDWVGISLFGHMYKSKLNAEGDAVFEFAREHKKPVMVAESSPIRGIDKGDCDAWDNWFVNFLSLTYNRNVKAISFINTNWDRHAIEGISEWRDARLQNNEKVYRAWFQETSKDRYLKQSLELFELLGFTR
jgi:hypothetical protein